MDYRPVQIQQILRVSRGVELQLFMEDLGNIKPLLHSTSPSSFVGILSRLELILKKPLFTCNDKTAHILTVYHICDPGPQNQS